MQITSVERDKKNNDKMMVYIENNFSFSISEDDFISLHMYEKSDLSSEEIEYIKNVVNFRTVKSAAVRYVSLKLRSEAEVKEKLLSQGYDNDAIEKVIDELKGIGYIDDSIYARKYIFDRSKLKPKPKKMLYIELEQKGIPKDIISEELENWEVDEYSIAEGLIRKKFGKYDFNDAKVIKKIYSFLFHRGFTFDVIDSSFKNVKKEFTRGSI